ncbi:UDP-N-acetylmuramoyl-L-alanyl-D-glutamate--2,6-diaminopimelate ligase [Fredinandcohnia quinoae]|uniref:UDP-N-acetylmuramoyl-L-alanyl-D-glutamate--2,6-diaminopimelate ligase n=1 Tax=Fredinandcohnia quinoae TaxID=2918902 RepID=A0AAW5DX32_9BACI|nr:UDP-N-acetylmuramoyl-L-alanyl-D-glutamate--2,6-diaminopimelate ligase [Fredinandcohnia sp. SECRCQ15]MCH1623879.1 UDP-N-acetylmuramoyl-L-alanyl-D-glutamate--2,6-diaminopimelate ligase [Fredinandcohnia sp. SECRCQ15]
MQLQKLLAHLHDFTATGTDNPLITSLEMDSREVKKGSLFFCVTGHSVDGHLFAKQAEELGAAALIAEKYVDVSIPVIIVKDSKRSMAQLADIFYNQPTHQLHLIGVTGTNGKTSISHIIEQIFQAAGRRIGLIGTMYSKIGKKKIEMKNTTPESLTLQKIFHQMVQEKADSAVMEVSSHAIDLGRIHGCDFNIAVFSNLTQDHLDYHHSMDEYRRVKGLLFSGLGNRFEIDNPKFAVLNSDDEATLEYKKSTSATVITYGINHESDIMAKNIVMTSTGTSFELITPVGRHSLTMKLIGMFSVYNVLAAVSASLLSSIPLAIICKSIESIKGIAGRFEVVNAGQNYTVIVDYAHTPDSLENVLKTVKQFSIGKIIVVVGCGGDRDRTKRPIMAQIAAKYADMPIFTSDNPRSENPLHILKDMEAGVNGEKYVTIIDREKAIKYAITNANKGDTIVIAGKGHETYQIIGSNTFEFDDRLVATQAIKEMK